MPATISQEKWIEWTVSEPRRIAVVGLSNREDRDSYRASFYLHDKGYDIIPVNPNCDSIEGLQCYPSLADIPGTIDIVNIFQRIDRVPSTVVTAIRLKPKLIWMQLGVTHAEAADSANSAGIGVIMDRCIKIEHQKQHGR
ncbi:CoA-binding protein [Luminiphilus sp.]|nr:CoA-binding protein [Luminiphilus sp.]